jgi:hypothetical protein
MKKIKLIDLKVSLFSKQSLPQPQYNHYETTQIQEQKKPIFVPSITDLQSTKREIISNTQQVQQNRPKSIAFTADLLQSALLKLKKPKTEEETHHIPIENEQIVNQISNLKHVETQETNIMEIFRQEHKEKMKKDYLLLKNINSNMTIIFENMNNNILTGLQTLKKIDRLQQYGRISDYS